MRLIAHRELNLLSNGIIAPLEGFLGFSILGGIGKKQNIIHLILLD
jgi:hypothetical protein